MLVGNGVALTSLPRHLMQRRSSTWWFRCSYISLSWVYDMHPQRMVPVTSALSFLTLNFNIRTGSVVEGHPYSKKHSQIRCVRRAISIDRLGISLMHPPRLPNFVVSLWAWPTGLTSNLNYPYSSGCLHMTSVFASKTVKLSYLDTITIFAITLSRLRAVRKTILASSTHIIFHTVPFFTSPRCSS